MKKRTNIVIGFGEDPKKNYFSGQAVMIDLFNNILLNQGYKTIRILLNSKFKEGNTVGAPSWKRYIEYVLISLKIIFCIITHPKSVVYLSPTSNKMGCLRDLMVIKIAHLCGCKIFLQQFGNRFKDFLNEQSPKFRNSILNNYAKADVITVEGENMLQQFKEYGFNNVELLHNGLKLKEDPSIKIPKQIIPDSPVNLFYMNLMIESKGYWDVIEAMDILVNEYGLEVNCTFAGGFRTSIDDEKFKSVEEAESSFNKYINDHNLKSNIKYLPGIYGEQKLAEWKISHFFLLPSYFIFEGMPTAPIEAMAYGVVPIVTRHALIPETIDKSCGIFVDKKSPRQIADSVKLMISEPQHYTEISSEANKRFMSQYSIGVYEKNLMDIYHKYFDN